MYSGFVTPRVISNTDTPNVFYMGGAPQFLEVTMVSTAVDARSTGETWKLQAGLAMGKITTGGKYREYLNASSDGSELMRAFLVTPINMKEPDGAVRDQIGIILIGGTMIDESACGGLDANGITDIKTLNGSFMWDTDY